MQEKLENIKVMIISASEMWHRECIHGKACRADTGQLNILHLYTRVGNNDTWSACTVAERSARLQVGTGKCYNCFLELKHK